MPDTFPDPAPPHRASFVRGTVTKREIAMGVIHGRIQALFAQGQKNLDDFVSKCETYVNLGWQGQVSGSGGRVQISSAELKEFIGDAFAELEHYATQGRALLTAAGFESKASVAPAMLLGQNQTEASAYAENFTTEMPGEPPLSGVKITPFATNEAAQP
jgi:hypothetical protein